MPDTRARAPAARIDVMTGPPTEVGSRDCRRRRTPQAASPSVAREGYALVIASYATAALGLLYWLAAGRLYDEEVVGVCAALISALTFLANVATLGLKNGLIRFVPGAGRHTQRLVIASYSVTFAVGAVAAVAFIAGRRWWAADIGLHPITFVSGLFVVSTAFWVVFVLQDSVLVGLRRASWVPVENSIFAVAKLALLVAFADRAARWGVFYSWVIPVVPIVIAISVATAWALRQVPVERRHDGEMPVRTIIRFAAADYGASLTWLAATTLLPLEVLARAGGETNAHYFMAWSIAFGLYQVVGNFGDAYVASAAADHANADRLLGQVARHALLLTVPGVTVVVIGAPWILGFVGQSYADEATIALRLLALSTLPFLVVGLSIARARVELRLRSVSLTFGTLSIAVLVLSSALLGPYGASGVAAGWLIAQTLVAAALVIAQRRDIPRIWSADAPPKRLAPLGAITDLQPTIPRSGASPFVAPSLLRRRARTGLRRLRPLRPFGRVRSLRPEQQTLVTTVLVVGAGAALWLHAAANTDLQGMNDLGLLSVTPVTFYLALGIVVLGALHLLRRPELPERALLAHLGALIVFIHGFTPLVYGTLRYGWAWKHVGLVEYIQRNGSVDRDIAQLDVYHNWPGFFSASALLSNIAGTENTMRIAIWAPVVFSLLTLVALRFVLQQLTDDRRVVWLTCLFYFATNWVGQEYFSPQAMAHVLYLIIIGLVLLAFGKDAERRPSTGLTAITTILVIALVSSHQLTPGALVTAVLGLTLTRQLRSKIPAVIVLAVPALWAATFAFPYVRRNVGGELGSFGTLFGNADGSLAETATQSEGQQLVSLMGRTAVVAIGLFAVIGLIRRWRLGHRDIAAAVLMVSPAGLLAANDFDGEIIFRVFLFAVPFLALFAARALLPTVTASFDRRSVVAASAMVAIVLTGFLFGHFGKERQNYFSPDEIAAANSILDLAPDGALIIEAEPYYATNLLRYERFEHVPFSKEPPESRDRVLADPAGVFAEWLRSTDEPTGFVVFTRSQQALAEATGDLPIGTISRLTAALESAPEFELVFTSPNATVFRLREETP
ncbi:MAG: hypothetical protein KDB21_07060 [Acidimicrobiales bacterium]|nr:hypothetical protein [Acidimicrobiales bacterium]